MRRILRHTARLALSGIFVYAGTQAAREPGPRVGAAPKIGLPASPELVRFNGAAMVVGGIALGLGIVPRLAARRTQTVQLFKNLGLMGGLVLVAAEPG